jgi:hypothetical protein
MATRKADRPLQRYLESARPVSFATVELHHHLGHDPGISAPPILLPVTNPRSGLDVEGLHPDPAKPFPNSIGGKLRAIAHWEASVDEAPRPWMEARSRSDRRLYQGSHGRPACL